MGVLLGCAEGQANGYAAQTDAREEEPDNIVIAGAVDDSANDNRLHKACGLEDQVFNGNRGGAVLIARADGSQGSIVRGGQVGERAEDDADEDQGDIA